ncbi:unnamed protein product [Boreogadus saida]
MVRSPAPHSVLLLSVEVSLSKTLTYTSYATCPLHQAYRCSPTEGPSVQQAVDAQSKSDWNIEVRLRQTVWKATQRGPTGFTAARGPRQAGDKGLNPPQEIPGPGA